MNEPCFSVCSFPSILYSRRFRNEVSDDVIIMRFPINKSPPPLWGRVRVGGLRRGFRKHSVHQSGQGTRPPTLILRHKGGGDQKFGHRGFRPLGEVKSTNSRRPLIHVGIAVFVSPGRGSCRAECRCRCRCRLGRRPRPPEDPGTFSKAHTCIDIISYIDPLYNLEQLRALAHVAALGRKPIQNAEFHGVLDRHTRPDLLARRQE